MPLYEYECDCGHLFELHRPMRESSDTAPCRCGKSAERILSRAIGYVQRECRYDSPIDGRPISSWAERREDLARNNCREYDPEMKKDAAKFREEAQAKLERSVDESVERSILKMDGRQREKLGAELSGGADATPTRKTVDKSTTVEISK